MHGDAEFELPPLPPYDASAGSSVVLVTPDGVSPSRSNSLVGGGGPLTPISLNGSGSGAAGFYEELAAGPEADGDVSPREPQRGNNGEPYYLWSHEVADFSRTQSDGAAYAGYKARASLPNLRGIDAAHAMGAAGGSVGDVRRSDTGPASAPRASSSTRRSTSVSGETPEERERRRKLKAKQKRKRERERAARASLDNGRLAETDDGGGARRSAGASGRSTREPSRRRASVSEGESRAHGHRSSKARSSRSVQSAASPSATGGSSSSLSSSLAAPPVRGVHSSAPSLYRQGSGGAMAVAVKHVDDADFAPPPLVLDAATARNDDPAAVASPLSPSCGATVEDVLHDSLVYALEREGELGGDAESFV